MKKEHALALEAASPAALAWALLVAETGAALMLFSSGRMPAVLLRCLQLFLRF